MDKFKNKYRIPSARHPNWDYNNDGAYFITICTENREHFLGECKNDKMKLFTIGAIVQGFWYDIPKHCPHVELGVFQVMPNHIHGIIIIDRKYLTDQNIGNENTKTVEKFEDIRIESDKTEDLKNEFFQKISPKPGSLSTILRSFKSVCTRHIHADFPQKMFEWQERFWDNIIKSDEDFIRISEYIINNPKNWRDDKFYNEGSEL